MSEPSSNAEKHRVLVLQGGGALGSYQAGTYEALDEANVRPGWIAGISIGAINAALIAGNAPEHRLERMKGFWDHITGGIPFDPAIFGEGNRAWFNKASALWITAFGVPGFFAPRFPPPLFMPVPSQGIVSHYDTTALKATLETFVDFDRINTRETRLSVGAVNVRTGNLAYFDNMHETIRPEHIMASGALPPGFPPVEIGGEFYWDGGLVSNTPLQYVLDEELREDLTIFQVDLFSAQGPLPRTLADAAEREKDIRFSSRTRLNTKANVAMHEARTTFRRVLDRMPPELRADPDVKRLDQLSVENSITVVQLIYRKSSYESDSKDFEFSRATMREHWAAGLRDVRRTIRHRAWIERSRPTGGVAVFDLTREAQG